MEVPISSHEAEAKGIKKEMQNGKILHLSNKLSPDSEGYLTETPTKPEEPDLVPTSDNNIVKPEKSIDKRTDTDENPKDLIGGTALSQSSNASDSKVNALSSDKQISLCGVKRRCGGPLAIIEVPSEAVDGKAERNTSLLFVKTFLG